MEHVEKAIQKLKSGNSIPVPGAYFTREEIHGIISDLYSSALQVCQSRSKSLAEGGMYTASNEAEKCALALEFRLGPVVEDLEA